MTRSTWVDRNSDVPVMPVWDELLWVLFSIFRSVRAVYVPRSNASAGASSIAFSVRGLGRSELWGRGTWSQHIAG